MRRAGFPSWLILITLLAGWFAAGVGTAPPAAAHAELVSTDPAEGARLEDAPERITLRFSEPVSLGAGYARLVHSDGTVQPTTASVDDGILTLDPGGELPVDRGYLVTYRVISADSHPISGAYSFVVGDADLVTDAAADPATDPGVAAALPAARWAGFAGVALAIGVPVLALVCWPAGWASHRLGRLAGWGAGAVATASVVSFLVQGPYAAASSLATAFQPSLLAATAESGAGRALLARAVLALGLAAVLAPAWRRGTCPSVARAVVAGLLAAGVVVGTAATGHPVAGPWPGLAVAAAVVHVAAMAIWLGGLTGLLLVVLRPPTPGREVAAVLPPWSRLAFAAVAALVVSGTVQAVREVGSPAALFVTTYGWVLVAKLVLVAVALAAAGVSRMWVHQRLGIRRARPPARRSVPASAFAGAPGAARAPVDGPVAVRERIQTAGAVEHVPALRRSVLVEVAVAAVVLALSAVLVGTPPARSAVDRPVDVLLPLEGNAGPSGSVQISVDPARAGANTLHVYLFDDSGRPTQPAAISVTLAEPSQELGPLDVDLEPAGPGHYVGDGMSIPGAGTWTLAVTVRLDEFTATTARTAFPVR
ncbi:FixH family protein [Blastococcus sp. CT_GayMR19]|uniref:copper resistance CopC family protein n=1 Tax=Blastococcus sp. CT_GayMR19 TaxID=2559608 RepID=UPI001ADDCE85|nr:FixH family protein [Blastococcus sp. CT_GayMR19]